MLKVVYYKFYFFFSENQKNMHPSCDFQAIFSIQIYCWSVLKSPGYVAAFCTIGGLILKGPISLLLANKSILLAGELNLENFRRLAHYYRSGGPLLTTRFAFFSVQVEVSILQWHVQVCAFVFNVTCFRKCSFQFLFGFSVLFCSVPY